MKRRGAPEDELVDQLLTPVGATAVRDQIRVKRFGIAVAHFEETIRKLD